MKVINYIIEIIKNESFLEQIKNKKLQLENEIITKSFINKWNNNKIDINQLSKEDIKAIDFLFEVRKIFIDSNEKLEKWYFEFEYFFESSKRDVIKINEEYRIEYDNNRKNHEEKSLHESTEILNNKNKVYICSSMKKSNKLLELEKKINYVLKNVFSAMYFLFDELCYISYSLSFVSNNKYTNLKDKIYSLNNIYNWNTSIEENVALKELSSFMKNDKTWDDVTFPLTLEKLEEFLNLSLKIYHCILNVISIKDFINKIQEVHYEVGNAPNNSK